MAIPGALTGFGRVTLVMGLLALLSIPDMPLYNPSGAGGGVALADTATTVSNQTVVFSNSNGVSFGLNGSTMTATVATNYQSAGAYLTTAMASNRGSDFVNATAAFAGTSASGTIASNGISVSIGPYLTTAMASNRGSDFVQAAAAFAGTSASGTIASNGISVSIGPYITTAALSGDTTKYAGVGETVGTIAGSDLAMTVDTNGVNIGYPKWLTTADLSANSSKYVQAWELGGNTAGTTSSLQGTKLYLVGGNNITLSGNSNSITVSAGAGGGAVVSNAIQQVSSATGSGTNTSRFAADDHVHAGVYHMGVSNDAGNTVGDTRVSFGRFVLRGGDNITLSQITAANELNTIVVSAAAAGGANTLTYCYEPFDLQDGTATMTCSLSQLHVQPFVLQNNISFGQINYLGIATVVPTSASNSHSARLTNSTQRYTFGSSYTIGNTNIMDLFLFSRGAGVSTSELQTFASTRNSFATNYQATYNGGATLTNTAGGSVSGSQTISMTISYPFLTSYTSTSVNPASSYTGWSSGYTTWTSAANNNSTFTFSTSAARTLSIGSTYPATVGWSGAKRINMNFATSLSAGEYWLGCLRHSSSSSSSSSANAFTGAAGTGNSYSATFNHTGYANTGVLTIVGKTATVVNSLGSLGFVTTANMAMEPGLGSFSGTWASNTTYLNNMANPAGAIAFTQVRSDVSFFRSWFQLASNMPV